MPRAPMPRQQPTVLTAFAPRVRSGHSRAWCDEGSPRRDYSPFARALPRTATATAAAATPAAASFTVPTAFAAGLATLTALRGSAIATAAVSAFRHAFGLRQQRLARQ